LAAGAELNIIARIWLGMDTASIWWRKLLNRPGDYVGKWYRYVNSLRCNVRIIRAKVFSQKNVLPYVRNFLVF
jgi:hypothetical protein